MHGHGTYSVTFSSLVLRSGEVVRHINGWVGMDIYVLNGTNLLNVFVCDGKTEFLFCKSEVQPELSPCPESILGIVICFCPTGRH